MDYKPLPVGVDLFEHLITRGYYYVDKTNFIRELLDKKAAVNLFTRPRRFGKTLNMSMLKCFFEDARGYDGEPKDNRCLFEGLDIMSAGDKYLAHMGQYPVIFLTLKGAKQPDFPMAYAMLRGQIAKEFERHAYILKSERLVLRREKYTRLHGAFIGRDAGTVEEELNDILLETISSLDAGENYYHGLVAGLLTGIKGYVVKSNREGGKKDSADAETFGRSDLFLKPVSRRKEAFVVEFKMAKRFSELDARADEALAQIADRQYDRELRDDEYSIISHYGMAFCGKECRVRLAEPVMSGEGEN